MKKSFLISLVFINLLAFTNSTVTNGKGWGMVIETGSTVNNDITTANTFCNNDSGAYQIPAQ